METIVIIGAARSGTKILRDVLATGLSVGAVPYDVGYVWSHGQPRRSHDELSPNDLTVKQASTIRNFVGTYARGGAVIEKTVANTLRVPYVASVFPEATIVSLVRDGVDVTMSAVSQWSTPPSLGYLAKKARHFPWRLAPTYGRDYLANTLAGHVKGAHSRSWGPRYRGMTYDIERLPLELVCARQWAACVNSVQDVLPSLQQPVLQVRYEDFVADPSKVVIEIGKLIGRSPAKGALQEATSRVHRVDLSKGRRTVPLALARKLARELNPTLRRLGYAEVDAA